MLLLSSSWAGATMQIRLHCLFERFCGHFSKAQWWHLISRLSRYLFGPFFLLKPRSRKWLENDEVKEADEKFGKWWKSTTWWKVWKVMKVDNLMKSWESDEIWENVEKNAICFTVFLFDIFLYKRIFPKSCSLILRWPILASKSNRRIASKNENENDLNKQTD